VSEPLFDAGPREDRDFDLSRDQRRTLRNRATLRRGFHPATRRPLRFTASGQLSGETCGGCAHHTIQGGTAGSYHKCARHWLGGQTRGASSDIRVSWPACELYEEAES
jgi:hypothetical protein